MNSFAAVLRAIHSWGGFAIAFRAGRVGAFTLGMLLLLCPPVQAESASTPAPRHAHRQQGAIAGTVVDSASGETLPGVNVAVVGTQRGTSTDADGQYTISGLEPGTYTLEASFVGYETKTLEGVQVADGETTQRDITLQSSTVALEDVVVTALGIEREERSVSYSVSEVETEEVVQGTESNVANLLQGQVSGVTITSTGGGTGASTRVDIRGVSSLTGDGQPLYVVDGVPIDNSNFGSAGKWGGFDGGDGIQSLSPSDIESMSVLKGAAASALYGSRARDGVVLITTKSGQDGAVRATYSNSTTFSLPRTTLDEIQTTYGQGTGGRRPQSQSMAHQTNRSSWGAPFDGQPTVQYDGVERPYEDIYGAGSPASEFYQTGVDTRNSLSLNGGTESITYYFSASNLSANGVTPNAGMNRTSLTGRGTASLAGFRIDAKANYIDEAFDNRAQLGDEPGNVAFSVKQLPRNLPLSVLENNVYKEDGSSRLLIQDFIWTQNPYWIVNEQVVNDDRDRLIGSLNADYALADWLNLNARTGLDFYTLRRKDYSSWGSPVTPRGAVADTEFRVMERNTNLRLRASRDLTSALTLDAMVGAGRRYENTEIIGVSGEDYILPQGNNVISNTANRYSSYDFSEQEVRSAYGSLDLGYNDYVYLNLTGRNDWSSTLPEENNSYFYPSIGGSFVFSSAFDAALPDWLSYGQLRGSWAQVGSDTGPYQLNLNYAVSDNPFNGESYSFIASNTLPPLNLKPTKTNEVEVGGDVRFFGERLGIDVSWYDRQTTNQIISLQMSNTSGFGARRINAGRIDNTGWEVQLTGEPVAGSDFQWRSTLNYTTSKTVVRELAEGVERLTLAEARSGIAWIVAEEGAEYGMIRGTTYERDEAGNIVHQDGVPVQGPRENLGRGTPDWTAGWSNTLSYGNFTLNALLDVSWGGQIFSGTNAILTRLGLHEMTLEGRAACDDAITPTGYPSGGCHVYEGVDSDGGPNETPTTPNLYFTNLGREIGGIAEEFIYDNNTIYVRQLRLGYALPDGFVARFGLRSASVSAIARNPFILYKTAPNIDPTLSMNRGNAQGLERMLTPSVRSFGVNLNLQF